jgi:hypothetical protein
MDRPTPLGDPFRRKSLSVHADLLKERIPARGISFDDLMQADLVLFIRAVISVVKDRKSRIFWWPETLVWLTRRYMPFEIFARGSIDEVFWPNIKDARGHHPR